MAKGKAKKRRKTPYGDDVLGCTRKRLASGVMLEICEVDRTDEETGTARRGVYVRALQRRVGEVGNVTSIIDGRRLRIESIEVEPEARGSHLGTTLYETTLEYACARGLTLASDAFRSPFAEAFWLKQVRKSRAVCSGDGEGEVYAGPIRELRNALPADEYMAIVERLPMPARKPDGKPYWPCQAYEIKPELCQTKPHSLAALRGVRGLAYPAQPCGLSYEDFRSGWKYADAYEHIAYRPESKGTSQRAVLREMRALKQAEYERYQDDCERGADPEAVVDFEVDPRDYMSGLGRVPTLSGLSPRRGVR